MWYKLKNIYVWTNHVRPSGWQPWANTIAYYKFEWDANDYSWNGHNLTASWNVSYVTNSWASKEVVYLNGSSSSNTTWFVSADFSQQLTPSTFVMWYKAVNNGGSNPLMVIFVQMYKNTNAYARTGVITARSSDNFTIRAYRDFVFNSWVQPDFWWWWHCVVVTVWEWNAKLYLDWEYKNGTTYTTADITETTRIYIWKNDDTGFGYKWWISDTIIENKSRTAQEVADYYDQTKSNYWIS